MTRSWNVNERECPWKSEVSQHNLHQQNLGPCALVAAICGKVGGAMWARVQCCGQPAASACQRQGDKSADEWELKGHPRHVAYLQCVPVPTGLGRTA